MNQLSLSNAHHPIPLPQAGDLLAGSCPLRSDSVVGEGVIVKGANPLMLRIFPHPNPPPEGEGTNVKGVNPLMLRIFPHPNPPPEGEGTNVKGVNP